MTHSDKAPTAEQLAMADRIAAKFFPVERLTARNAALAAIRETTELAAKLAEDRYLETDWQEPGQCIADAIRNNDHLKGPKP